MKPGERGPRGDHGQEGHIGLKGDKGDKGDEGVENPTARWFRRGLVIWIITFSCVALYAIYGNTQRIHDIQQSRIHSCERTYQKLGQVMHLSSDGRKLTPTQQLRLNKIFKAIDPKQCVEQTATHTHAFPFPPFVEDALAGN